MNKKLIMSTAISVLTGAALGYHGVQWYGNNDSPYRDNEGIALKESRENKSSALSVISNNPDKKKKLVLEEILKENRSYRKNCKLYTYYASIRSEQREEEFKKILALDKEQQNQALYSFFSSWAKQEPRRALAKTAELSDPFDRNLAHYYVFSAWAEKNPENAAAYFLENKDRWDENSMFIMQMSDGMSIGGSCSIVENLAKISPEKALEWLDHIENKKDQNNLKNNLINILAKKDPLALLKNSAQFFPGEENKTYAAIAGQWAKRDPAAAQQWVETLPEDEKTKSHKAIVIALTEDNPQNALTWAQKNLDIKTLSNNNRFLISALHDVEHSQAKQWMQSFPDCPEKYRIMQEYASSWYDRNYTEQVEFIFTIPDKKIQNEAMGRVGVIFFL